MKARKKTLANGLRLITVPMKDNPALTVMVVAAVGSNNESRDQQGLAHFLEHMIMKGGQKYPTAQAVSSTLDALGAESNAFTGSEFTGYYAKGHPRHFSAMLSVIADFYLTPRLKAEDLVKERGVVIEEINMYDDLPMAKVGDILDRLMYGDQPAGWSTLGTKEIIKKIDRSVMSRFHARHYTAANTVVIVAGDLPARGVNQIVEELFDSLPAGRPARRPRPKISQTRPAIALVAKPTDQVHLSLGWPAYSAGHRRLPALCVLNAILGGGMSSRLFQKLREEMGVCYYVRSQVEDHDTYGALVISAGVDTGRLVEVIEVIMTELKQLKNQSVEAKELQKVKDYLTGRILLGLETSAGVAGFYLNQEILTGLLETPGQWTKKIQGVTAAEVRQVAREIFQNRKLNLAAIGRIKNPAAVKRAFKL